MRAEVVAFAEVRLRQLRPLLGRRRRGRSLWSSLGLREDRAARAEGAGSDAHRLREASDLHRRDPLPVAIVVQRPRPGVHVGEDADALAAAIQGAPGAHGLRRLPPIPEHHDAVPEKVDLGEPVGGRALPAVAVHAVAHGVRRGTGDDAGEEPRAHGLALEHPGVLEVHLPVVLPGRRQRRLPDHVRATTVLDGDTGREHGDVRRDGPKPLIPPGAGPTTGLGGAPGCGAARSDLLVCGF